MGGYSFLLRTGEESEATTCKGVGKGAECQHSVLSGKAGNEASLLAREASIERTVSNPTPSLNGQALFRNLGRHSGHC